jgi:hypothetical protein
MTLTHAGRGEFDHIASSINFESIPADVDAMPTNGGYSTRRISEARRQFLRKHGWLLALVFLFVVGVSFAVAWSDRLFSRWIDPGLVRAFILGAGFATAVALVAVLMGMDGARSFREGREAERWTARELNRLRKRGWYVLHDLEIDEGNIDHLLIGPEGVVTVETKLRSADWTITDVSIEDDRHRVLPWLDRLLYQAKSQAWSLRSLLSRSGVRTEVLPVMVLWGRNLKGASGVTIDGVLLGLGRDIDQWIGQLRSKPLAQDQVQLAIQAVNNHKAGKEATPVESEPSRTPQRVSRPSASYDPLPPSPWDQPEPVSGAHR